MRRWACLVVLVGCGVPREDYAERKAKALCALERRCAVGQFYVDYADNEACVSRQRYAVDDELEEKELCTYDPVEAARCDRRLRHLSCDDYVLGFVDEPCDLVFDCGFDR